MFGSEILEVAIGIIFIYVLVAIMCSAIREGIEAWLKTRAAYLERGIRELLNDQDGLALASDFYRHPLIFSLFAGDYNPLRKPAGSKQSPKLFANGRGLPSYIPSKNFAIALMDLAARGPIDDPAAPDPHASVLSLDQIRNNITRIENKRIQRVLLTAIDTAQNDINRFQANIEAWYDSGMDRVSGWYKRSTQWILFAVGLLVAVVANINTITIADYLYRNDAARAALVRRAEIAAADTAFQGAVARSGAADTTPRVPSDYAMARMALDSLRLPIGWENGLGTSLGRKVDRSDLFWYNIMAPLLGWLLTALAAMMGAPFWFDLLNKVMVIRSTVKPHEKSPEEGSEDRRDKQIRLLTTALAGQPLAQQTPQPQQPGAATPTPPAVPVSADIEAADDACEVEIDEFTNDEDLPESKGGVA